MSPVLEDSFKKPSKKWRGITKVNHQAVGRFLDEWVVKSKNSVFLAGDPISIPYRYQENLQECELVAYLTALFSYGRRDLIIQTVEGLIQRMGTDPLTFVESFDVKRDAKRFDGFVYRFYKSSDVVFLLQRLQQVYQDYGSLEACMTASHGESLQQRLVQFTDILLAGQEPASYGQKFMFAHPNLGGPCKRLNMFLRWMVRQDEPGCSKIDLGLWQDALTPAELMIPLDTHVTKMNKLFGFTKRKTADWQTVEEITAVLRQFCPEDPLKYDFALMGLGLQNITEADLIETF